MRVGRLTREILVGLIQLENEILTARVPRGASADVRDQIQEERAAVRKYGPPWRPVSRIVGHEMSPGESVSASRIIRRLADRGLVRLTRWQGEPEIANVQLTAAGRKLAEELTP